MILFLTAIVAANLLITWLGPKWLPLTAFVLIPFDLVTRDVLHERWEYKSRRALWGSMGALICAGGLLSLLLNLDSWRIAMASCIAFSAAGLIDTVVYQVLREQYRWVKMNGSNAASALTDSIIFPAIGFGIFDPHLTAGQASAKFIGGVVWSTLFVWWLTRRRNANDNQ